MMQPPTSLNASSISNTSKIQSLCAQPIPPVTLKDQSPVTLKDQSQSRPSPSPTANKERLQKSQSMPQIKNAIKTQQNSRISTVEKLVANIAKIKSTQCVQAIGDQQSIPSVVKREKLQIQQCVASLAARKKLNPPITNMLQPRKSTPTMTNMDESEAQKPARRTSKSTNDCAPKIGPAVRKTEISRVKPSVTVISNKENTEVLILPTTNKENSCPQQSDSSEINTEREEHSPHRRSIRSPTKSKQTQVVPVITNTVKPQPQEYVLPSNDVANQSPSQQISQVAYNVMSKASQSVPSISNIEQVPPSPSRICRNKYSLRQPSPILTGMPNPQPPSDMQLTVNNLNRRPIPLSEINPLIGIRHSNVHSTPYPLMASADGQRQPVNTTPGMGQYPNINTRIRYQARNMLAPQPIIQYGSHDFNSNNFNDRFVKQRQMYQNQILCMMSSMRPHHNPGFMWNMQNRNFSNINGGLNQNPSPFVNVINNPAHFVPPDIGFVTPRIAPHARGFQQEGPNTNNHQGFNRGGLSQSSVMYRQNLVQISTNEHIS